MKRREPTEDEVALFEAALKDAARRAPKTVSPRAATSGKSKTPSTRSQANTKGPAPSPAGRGTKRRNKPEHGSFEPLVQPEPEEADEVAALRHGKLAEERALFEAALKDTVRLGSRPETRLRRAPAKGEANASSAIAGPGVPAAGPTGLDGRRRTKLRRGSLEPEARLDLHGFTETAAHHALTHFVHQAMARGLRLVLIVTGKGGSAARDSAKDGDPFIRRRGVLRQLTPRWLKEPGLAQFVAEMTPAHRRHGGEGALYVYLRKPS